jgi:hypothetical protein
MDSYSKDLFKSLLWGLAFLVGFGLLVWFIIILLYMGFGPSQEQLAKDRSMQVIQEMDGCKVYRFYDSTYHYITRCGADVTTQKNWDENCGKACTRHRTEDITTKGNQ